MSMNRREFASLAALGVAAPLVISTSGFARAQGNKRLIGVIEEDPAIINPGITTVTSSFTAGCPVYSALTYIDGKGAIHPDLATSWEISNDGLNYTFNLRKNVQWHDGKSFTAEDVKFSLENMTAKLHPWGKTTFAPLKEVEIVDPYKVIIRLERPSPALLVSTTNLMGAILPKHIWQNEDPLKSQYNRKPVGTGPFMLVEARQGDRLIYRKNPKYYIPGQPAFDELVFRIIPDPAARVSAFESGEVDMLYSNTLPQTEVSRISRVPNTKVAVTSIAAPAYMCTFNSGTPALANVKVRQAIAHAINRDFIRSAVMPGLADKMIGPVPSVLPLHNKALKDYEYDQAKARRLLDEAGLKAQTGGERTRLRLLFNTSDARATRIADIIREQLRQVGVRADLQPLERATLIQRGYVSGEFDMLVDSFLLGPDPAVGVERLYISTNRHSPMRPFTNNSNYVNPEVDRLFTEEKKEVRLERRKPIYDRIQALIWADVPVLPIFSYRGANVYNSKVVEGIFDTLDGSKESFARARAL
jgi:peptide/nickel transport system substrate-binding protein